MDKIKDLVAGSKLEAERRFASNDYLRDVEQRLSKQLLRIESKLDAIQQARGAD